MSIKNTDIISVIMYIIGLIFVSFIMYDVVNNLHSMDEVTILRKCLIAEVAINVVCAFEAFFDNDKKG